MTKDAPVVSANPPAIEDAVRLIKAGQLVAVPTETVYGLAADAGNAEAVARLYEVKGRPRFNPLICHVPDMAAAEDIVDVGPLAKDLMRAFWPGPLTLVLKKKKSAPVCDLVTAGLETLAVRAPAHPVLQTLLRSLGRPLAAPSANRSGRISPTSADHVAADLNGDVALILDGGPCSVGLESTILGVDDHRIMLLRPGVITADDVENAVGIRPHHADVNRITAPGQLLSHYAPRAAVRLNAMEKRADADEVMIGFGSVKGDFSLSHLGNLREAAAKLFSTLREADATGTATIAVAPIPDEGLGLAINDRLRRAAADR